MVISLQGCLRVSELTYLTFSDVQKDGNRFVICIRQSKTDQNGQGHVFTVTPTYQTDVCPCSIIQRYIDLFENKTGRFFRYLNDDGKPTAKPIGINSLSGYPQIVGDFLGLGGHYTGHCFRRSAATIAADAGASDVDLKRFGRWKSSSVASGYVDRSNYSSRKMSNMVNSLVCQIPAAIVSGSTEEELKTKIPDNDGLPGTAVFNNCQFSNCTFGKAY